MKTRFIYDPFDNMDGVNERYEKYYKKIGWNLYFDKDINDCYLYYDYHKELHLNIEEQIEIGNIFYIRFKSIDIINERIEYDLGLA